MLHFDQGLLWQMQDQREDRFEKRLCAHARAHFTERCAHLDDGALREATRTIVEHARGHGLASELGISLYYNVAVCMGMDFLRNPNIRWVFPIERHEEEEIDPGWIVRVSEIATATLKKYGK